MSRPKEVTIKVTEDRKIYVETRQELVGILGAETQFEYGAFSGKYDLDTTQLDAAIASARKLFGIQAGRAPLSATVVLG